MFYRLLPASSSYPLWLPDSTAIRYDRLIVLLSAIADWSYYSQTRHNTIDIHDSYIIFFFEPKSRYHMPKSTKSIYQERTGTDQPFYFSRTDPKQISLKWVDIRCFRNFENFQVNFARNFAPIIHGMHMPNDSSSWSSCTEVCRRVILDVKMYRFSYEIFKVDFLK